LKIFIGTVDISSRINDLTRELHRRGIETLTANRTRHYRYTSDVDIILSDSYFYHFGGVRPKSLQKRLRLIGQKSFGPQALLLTRVLNECDCAIFLWQSILDDHSDYRVLCDAGKKLVTCFVGDDIRWRPAAAVEFASAGITMPRQNESVVHLQNKLRFIKHAEQYSHLIFSRPDQSQLLRRPYHRMLPYVTAQDFSPNADQRAVPVIIHPCSDDPIKGVDIVRDALQELEGRGVKFTYRRITGMSQSQVRVLMRDADIVIDQMFLPGGGKVSVEAMMSGCVTLSCMAYDSYPQLYSERPPIVDISPHTLVDKLHFIIQDRQLRRRLAGEGPDFVRKFADISVFVDAILSGISETNADRAAPLVPEFLREHSGLLPLNAQQLINTLYSTSEHVRAACARNVKPTSTE
jgi:hypothetical protein